MVVVAQISDLHFNGTPEHRARAAAAVAYVNTAVQNAAVQNAGARHGAPAALLVTGDLADEGLPAQYAEAAATLVADLPVLTLLGNHDDRAAFTQQRTGTASTAPVNSSLLTDALLILALDSSIPGRPDGLLSPETLAWADAQIRAAGDVDVLLSWHHPPAAIGLPFIDGMRLNEAERVEDLLAAHPNIVGIVAGHAHTAAATVFGGRPLIVAPGVSSTLNLPFEGPGVATTDFGPGVAFHVIENHRLTTHFRVLNHW